MSKFLLTGGGGTLGTELKKHLDCWAPERDILDVKTFCDDYIEDISGRVHLFEETYSDELKDVKCIIHAAAWTDVPGAEIDQSGVVDTNIIGTYNIVRFARERNWRVIYISTDYVYPGHVGNYKETSKTEPFNFYGFTKLAGETFVDLTQDLIIRTSFKPNDLWETKYNKAFIDLYTSADYVDIVAPEIALVADSNLTGIINVATERKAIYELAKVRYPEVKEMSRWDVSQSIKLPSDISMNIDKFKEFKEFKESAGETNE